MSAARPAGILITLQLTESGSIAHTVRCYKSARTAE